MRSIDTARFTGWHGEWRRRRGRWTRRTGRWRRQHNVRRRHGLSDDDAGGCGYYSATPDRHQRNRSGNADFTVQSESAAAATAAKSATNASSNKQVRNKTKCICRFYTSKSQRQNQMHPKLIIKNQTNTLQAISKPN